MYRYGAPIRQRNVGEQKALVRGSQKDARAIEIHRSPAHSAGFQMPCKWKSGVYSSLAEVRSCVNPLLMPQSAM